MIGRTWLIGMGIIAVGLGAEREDGFTAAIVCLAAYTVHLATALLLRPLERNPRPSMSTGKQIALIVGGIYLFLIVLAIGIFGWSRLDNEEFKPQNEFKLDPWVELGPFDINKAVLYLVIASVLTIGSMLWVSRRMQAASQPRPDRGRVALHRDARQHHARQHGRQDGAQVVPVHRRAVPVHLVLEPDRLHPAADQHAREDRHVRPPRSRRSRSTPRPRTSRSRWRSRSWCSSPTTSRGSARRASAGTSRA